MNALSRPLFDMPRSMIEGTGITSMALGDDPEAPMPMDAPMPMSEQEARDIGGMMAGSVAGKIEETDRGIDAAEDELGMMNALRGENRSEEDYRDELSELVGPKDAAATPKSVLALVQPTLAMVQLGGQMSGQGGSTGGIGDLGGMGDLGDMSALMGGMGGDSLGGLATMLPQDQPMPMEMMAVEENIAGVMPTQMFLEGGAALSAPQIKEMLMSLQPAVPQTPEKGFWESALQIGAPAIAAGLMGEPGREWRTGLGMLAKSSSAALQEEEKRKLDNERLRYASEAGAGTKAGTAWLAQQTAADLAEANRIKALAGRTPSKITSTQAERAIAAAVRNNDLTAQEGRDLLLEIARNDAMTPESKAALAGKSAVAQAQEIANLKLLGTYGEEVNNAASSAGTIADRAREFQSAMKGIDSGPFTESFKNASDKIRQLAGLIGVSPDSFLKSLGAEGAYVDKEESGRIALGQEIGKQFTIAFATLVKGNLNESEFQEIKSLGPDALKTVEGNARIIELYERSEKRTLEKQQIYNDLYRSAPVGQSSRVTMLDIRDKIAEYEAGYRSAEAEKLAKEDPNFYSPLPTYQGNVDVAVTLRTPKMKRLQTGTEESANLERQLLREQLGSGDSERVKGAFRFIIGPSRVTKGSDLEKEQFRYYSGVFQEILMGSGFDFNQADATRIVKENIK